MDALLQQAIDPVLRDLERTAGVAVPALVGDRPGDPAMSRSMLLDAGGGGRGVYVVRAEPLAAQVAMAADQVHEWVIEERWPRAATNWPPCPHHAARCSDSTAWPCHHSLSPKRYQEVLR